jgi:hypothetical protein
MISWKVLTALACIIVAMMLYVVDEGSDTHEEFMD